MILTTPSMNGAFDPSLPGPTWAFGGAGAPPIDAADAVLQALGIARIASVVSGASMYLEALPSVPLSAKDWIAVSVHVAVPSAGDWNAISGRVAARLILVGGSYGPGGYFEFNLSQNYEIIDSTHRRYNAVFQNPTGAAVEKVAVVVNLSGVSVGVNVGAPAVGYSKERPDGVAWWQSDPLGVRALATQVNAASRTDPIVVLGDSLSVLPAAALAAQQGRTVFQDGIGGQIPEQIVNRAIGTTVRLSGTQIVSGNNSVTHLGTLDVATAAKTAGSMLLSTPADDNSRSLRGSIGLIAGVLTRSVVSATETYGFVPDAGQILPAKVPDDTPFVPDYAAKRGRTHLVSIGRNGAWNDGTALGQLQRLIRFLGHSRVLVLEVPNGDSNVPNEYGPSGGLYLQIAALNASYAAAFGEAWLASARLLKDRGLSLAGLTPNTQDAVDASNDVVSNQLRSDGLHWNSTGAEIIVSAAVRPALARMGW